MALVAAFMTRPDVLLLDEPTAGLDPLMEEQFQQLAREAASRGQAVFLSSHLLSEVEDVCSRVAILRRGRLVELAELSTLQGLGSTVLEATFAGPVPEIADLSGVTRTETIPDGLRIYLSGPPGPVLARLAAAGVARLRSHEPSLEEIFLSYYSEPEGASAPGAS